MSKTSRDDAKAIAISGLQFLAADDELVMRFSALTGILPNDMRSAAAQPGFLIGVLDFFLTHEPDLLAWTSAETIDPQTVAEARFVLAPEDQTGFQ